MATYALILGGGGDPWEWHRLFPELASRGHDAIAIRLPAEDDSAGWSEYADAVVNAIGDRANVILVGASMGGFTAPIVCTRRRVDLLVLLNAMIPVPGETFNTWGANTGSGPARRAYHASLGLSAVETEDKAVIYYHDLPSELRGEAQARTWQDQSMAPLDEPWPLNSWPDVPTRVLAGRHDRMFPLEFQRRVALGQAVPLLLIRVAPIASAAASPSIGTPRMIPKIGPGNEMAVKNSVRIRAYATPTLPLAASSPATTKDLRSRGTANAATARTATAMPGHGASPARRAPPIAMTTTNTTSVAAASPTASMVLEFVTKTVLLQLPRCCVAAGE